MILNFRPFGNPTFDNLAVGGDILVVAGAVTLIGTVFISWNLFKVSQVMGGNVAVLGE